MLTEEEVMASIRGWIREITQASDEVYNDFQRIAETRKLLKGAEFSYTKGWVYKSYYIDVWWIDLSITTGEKAGYTYRIRDRKISLRPLNDEEHKRLELFPPNLKTIDLYLKR